MEHYPPQARALLVAAIEAGAREGTPWDLELPFVTAKGNQRWVRAQGVAVCENGTPVRLLGAFQDITEKKNNALELHRLNEELTRLSTTDALTEVGNEHRASATSAWLGVSIGVASQVAAPDVDCGVLVDIADAALYRAKRCGRGRIEF